VTETFEAAPGIVAVDTRMAGRSHVTSAYLVTGEEPALIETGPSTSAEAVIAGLDGLGIGAGDLAHVVVTHIHLDHAGGAGTIAARFPRSTTWVHDRGAAHLADPARLVASASRVYGEDRLRQLFGPVDPVPADRIRAVDEGDRIRLGSRHLDVLHTPGHASHHVALGDGETGAVFVGDALGIHLPVVRVLRPATPPPDVDVEQGLDSIERIRRRARSSLLLSHFGPSPDVDDLCRLAAERLRGWAEVVREALERTDDVDRVTDALARRTDDELADARARGADLERYEILSSVRMNALGLIRYWRKRRKADAAGGAELLPD
jgi:glyoxylase-like metal-dependent hydrolase (beta-lactamase superfamily II)